MFIRCENCGKVFFTENRYAYYCSKECHDAILAKAKSKKGKKINPNPKASENISEQDIIIAKQQYQKQQEELKQKYYDNVDIKCKNIYKIIHNRWNEIREKLKNGTNM